MRWAAVVVVLGCHREPPPRPMQQIVTSIVLIERCPDAKKLDRRQATREIELLVGPCTKVPGGAAHFSTTLMPGGGVEFASPSGDPDEGVVPTCMMRTKAQLNHKLRLAHACRFDVKLEERK